MGALLCAVIFCRKALLKRRDQRALELWLLANLRGNK
jgi:hypothetical protein